MENTIWTDSDGVQHNKYPTFLVAITDERKRLKKYIDMLESLKPVPILECEEYLCRLSSAEKQYEDAWAKFCKVPFLCDCGGRLVAEGDDMVCVECGKYYYIEFEEIPF